VVLVCRKEVLEPMRLPESPSPELDHVAKDRLGNWRVPTLAQASPDAIVGVVASAAIRARESYRRNRRPRSARVLTATRNHHKRLVSFPIDLTGPALESITTDMISGCSTD